MCTGRVDPRHIFRAFSNGMDGVFIGGCRLNECHYTTHGNFQALNMVLLCKKILEYLGLNPERLRIGFMSSGDGIHYARTIDDFEKTVKHLGPLGDGEGIDKNALRRRIEEVTKLIPYIKIVKKEKLRARRDTETAYENLFSTDEISRFFEEVISYYIDPEKCQACMICFRKCTMEAIDGAKNQIHVIDQEKCIRCGNCFEVCPSKFGAVQKINGLSVPPAISDQERTVIRKNKKPEAQLCSSGQ